MVQPRTHTPASNEASKTRWLGLLALLVCSMMGACAKTTTERLNLPPLQTVSKVDLRPPPTMSETTDG